MLRFLLRAFFSQLYSTTCTVKKSLKSITLFVDYTVTETESAAVLFSASEMTYIVSSGALNSTHSLTTASLCRPRLKWGLRIEQWVKMQMTDWSSTAHSTWLVTSRLVSTRSRCRASRDERVEPCCSTSSSHDEPSGIWA